DKLHLHKVYRKVLAIAGISSAREMFPFKKKTFSSGFPEKIKGTPGMPHAVYFPGCSVNLAFENIGSSVIKILRQNGFTITVPDTVCCGMPPYNGGDPETAMVLGEKNLKILTDTNADIIVTSCSSGGSMLKHVYPEILGKKSLAVSEKVMDINDLMISLKNLKKPEIPVRKKITYHDPCHLNRRMHVNRQPRDIIKMIPGAEFIEMDTADTCCGGGGSFTLKHYELSLKILKKKIESFNRTGAEIIATACPACILQLKEGIRRFGRNKNALVLHTAELLASSYSDE
ncbi:MAG: (Fe-S)-binding protein, partial [Fibrobacterota bacterium]